MAFWNDLPERPITVIDIAAAIPPATAETFDPIFVQASPADAVPSATGVTTILFRTPNRIHHLRYDEHELGWSRVNSEPVDGSENVVERLGLDPRRFSLVVSISDGRLQYLTRDGDEAGYTWITTDHREFVESTNPAEPETTESTNRSATDAPIASTNALTVTPELSEEYDLDDLEMITIPPSGDGKQYVRQSVVAPRSRSFPFSVEVENNLKTDAMTEAVKERLRSAAERVETSLSDPE